MVGLRGDLAMVSPEPSADRSTGPRDKGILKKGRPEIVLRLENCASRKITRLATAL
jgi:hypothetical protein